VSVAEVVVPAAEPALDAADLADPLAFLYAEHGRIRIACQALLRLTETPAPVNRAEAAADLLAFVAVVLPRHVADEEEGLFPLLAARARAEDRLDGVLTLLRAEHREDVELGRPLRATLERIAEHRPVRDAPLFRAYVHAFAALQRRHHMLENDTVLPLAFERLSAADMATLAHGIAARRGIALG